MPIQTILTYFPAAQGDHCSSISFCSQDVSYLSFLLLILSFLKTLTVYCQVNKIDALEMCMASGNKQGASLRCYTLPLPAHTFRATHRPLLHTHRASPVIQSPLISPTSQVSALILLSKVTTFLKLADIYPIIVQTI